LIVRTDNATFVSVIAHVRREIRMAPNLEVLLDLTASRKGYRQAVLADSAGQACCCCSCCVKWE